MPAQILMEGASSRASPPQSSSSALVEASQAEFAEAQALLMDCLQAQEPGSAPQTSPILPTGHNQAPAAMHGAQHGHVCHLPPYAHQWQAQVQAWQAPAGHNSWATMPTVIASPKAVRASALMPSPFRYSQTRQEITASGIRYA
mmetsp:Transcript_17470/g.44749  ORF Transcript_17470/g.44749 Transcript_17470/m.44749 type:complete len:144 (+) Transcript_17470:47-478(+)